MSCEHCTDPDGISCFPQYGLGPHIHTQKPIGCTTLILDQTAPGFTPDPDEHGMGWWWCPACGDGKPDPAAIRSGK